MANSGEHRMLFDLRGRRKRVVQVAFGGLALLMALSLFTVVGPVSLGGLFGNGSSGSGSNVFNDQVQRLERAVKKNPNDVTLLAQLTRATFNAGNAEIQRDANGNPTNVTQSGIDDFNKSGDAWQRYVKTKPAKPDPSTAQLAAQALLYAAATGTALDFQPDITAAASAQAIYAGAKPSPNAYLTLAQFRYFAGDVAGAKQAGQKAAQAVPKSQRTTLKSVLTQYKTQGAQIQKQIKASAKFNPSGGGKQALQNPLGNLSGGGSGTGATTP